MKPLNLFFLLIMIFPAFIAQAQNEDPYREIFAIVSSEDIHSFRLDARGGDIRFTASEDDSIRVEVRMTISTIPDDEAKARLMRVNILDDVVDGRWEWRTDLDGMDIEWITRIIEIDYNIFLPEHIAMELTHRNGDVTISDRSAPVWVDLTIGSLSAGCLSADGNRIDVSFGKADIACLGESKVDINGGKLRIANASNLSLRGKGAEVYVMKADEVDIKAHAGEYHFRHIESIEGSLTSSHLEVDTLMRRGEMDLTLMVGAEFGLMAETESLDLEADMTPVNIRYPEARTVALDLEARRDDLSRIDIPGLPEAESLPDNQIRYRSDWSVARSAERPLELTVHSKRGRVMIQKQGE